MLLVKRALELKFMNMVCVCVYKKGKEGLKLHVVESWMYPQTNKKSNRILLDVVRATCFYSKVKDLKSNVTQIKSMTRINWWLCKFYSIILIMIYT